MSADDLQWTFAHENLKADGAILSNVPAMEFRFASAYLLPPVPLQDVCYVCFRVIGHPAVKLGVSSSREILSAFSDVETGWSMYLKKGELRHGSNTEGPCFFLLPQKQEQDVCIKLDRVQGTVDFMLLNDVIYRTSVSDAAFLCPDLFYFAVALYIGGLGTSCRPLWIYSYWEERKAALFLYAKGSGSIFQRLPDDLCRCALDYL